MSSLYRTARCGKAARAGTIYPLLLFYPLFLPFSFPPSLFSLLLPPYPSPHCTPLLYCLYSHSPLCSPSLTYVIITFLPFLLLLPSRLFYSLPSTLHFVLLLLLFASFLHSKLPLFSISLLFLHSVCTVFSLPSFVPLPVSLQLILSSFPLYPLPSLFSIPSLPLTSSPHLSSLSLPLFILTLFPLFLPPPPFTPFLSPLSFSYIYSSFFASSP